MAVDLPAFDLPQNATSAPQSSGHWLSLAALVRKLVLLRFIFANKGFKVANKVPLDR